jgi:hypothetical protein
MSTECQKVSFEPEWMLNAANHVKLQNQCEMLCCEFNHNVNIENKKSAIPHNQCTMLGGKRYQRICVQLLT